MRGGGRRACDDALRDFLSFFPRIAPLPQSRPSLRRGGWGGGHALCPRGRLLVPPPRGPPCGEWAARSHHSCVYIRAARLPRAIAAAAAARAAPREGARVGSAPAAGRRRPRAVEQARTDMSLNHPRDVPHVVMIGDDNMVPRSRPRASEARLAAVDTRWRGWRSSVRVGGSAPPFPPRTPRGARAQAGAHLPAVARSGGARRACGYCRGAYIQTLRGLRQGARGREGAPLRLACAA